LFKKKLFLPEHQYLKLSFQLKYFKTYYVTCRKMDGTGGGHHVKQNKPDPERQTSHVLSHMWKLDQKNKEQAGW
jgi:hypothetical protein